MSALAIPAPAEPVGKAGTNEPVVQGRYRTTRGVERVVWGQRVEGVVCLTDAPASGRGRCLPIEDGLSSRAELDAIVADYLHQAARHGGIPAQVLWGAGS